MFIDWRCNKQSCFLLSEHPSLVQNIKQFSPLLLKWQLELKIFWGFRHCRWERGKPPKYNVFDKLHWQLCKKWVHCCHTVFYSNLFAIVRCRAYKVQRGCHTVCHTGHSIVTLAAVVWGAKSRHRRRLRARTKKAKATKNWKSRRRRWQKSNRWTGQKSNGNHRNPSEVFLEKSL